MGEIDLPTQEYKPRPLQYRSHPTTLFAPVEKHLKNLKDENFSDLFSGESLRVGKMHSGQLEKAGSLRKRTLSRGMSEDESLRHIIREVRVSESLVRISFVTTRDLI